MDGEALSRLNKDVSNHAWMSHAHGSRCSKAGHSQSASKALYMARRSGFRHAALTDQELPRMPPMFSNAVPS